MTVDGRTTTDESPPTYRMLVADGVWRRWTLAVAGTRLPIAMAPLALVYIGHVATGSYGVGSVMASAYSFAEAFSAPGAARLLSRSADLRRGLALALGLGAACMLALALFSQLRASAVVLVVLAALCGSIPAAAQGGMRAMLQRLVPERLREKAFALDATLLEVQWAVAPALVALTVSLGAAPLAAVLMALAALLSAALVFTLPPTPSSTLEEPAAAPGKRREPAWRARAALGAYISSALLGYAEGTVTVGLPPLLGHIDADADHAGLLLVGLSLTSAVGGWAYGVITPRLGRPGPARAAILLAFLGLMVIPVAVAGSLWVAAAGVALFGLFVAPINALRSYQLGQALPEDQHTEGFSTLYGVNVLGFGISGLAAAALLSAADPRAPMLAAAIITTAAGVISLLLAGLRARRK
jgi:MFS family permease